MIKNKTTIVSFFILLIVIGGFVILLTKTKKSPESIQGNEEKLEVINSDEKISVNNDENQKFTSISETGLFIGEKDDVDKVRYAFSEIRKGSYKTEGSATNTSVFFLPYPDPNQEITTTSIAKFSGNFTNSDYFFLLQTKDTEDEISSVNAVSKDSRKYLTILSSSLFDKIMQNTETQEVTEVLSGFINKPQYVRDEFTGYNGFVFGALLEGWGFAKNLMHTPTFISLDDWFFDLKTPIFSVDDVEEMYIGGVKVKRYTLNIIKENILNHALEFQTKNFGHQPTSAEIELINDDFGKITDASIFLTTNLRTGDPFSLVLIVRSHDKTDKIYRDLRYTFEGQQSFIKTEQKIEKPKRGDDNVFNPLLFSLIAN